MLRPALFRPLSLRSLQPVPRAHPPQLRNSLLLWRSLSDSHERRLHPVASDPSESSELKRDGESAEQQTPPTPADTPSSQPPPAEEPSSSSVTPKPLENIPSVDELKDKLRAVSENAAIAVRERADKYTSLAAKTFAQLGRELNKVTGYEEIDLLKRQVAEQESKIAVAREAARKAKHAYDHAVRQRAHSQREVNDLLQRKSSWTDDDVSRFTALVRQDHLHEQAETRAKHHAAATEDEVEREFTELMRVILNRYHEEQVWSDKIRSASTYGSLTVLGLNMLVFVLAIIIVEPWKRKRLAQTFEKKVEEMGEATLAAFQAKTESLTAQLKEQDRVLAQLVEVMSYSLEPVSSSLLEEHSEKEVDHPGSQNLREDSLVSPSYKELGLVVLSSSIAGAIGWAVGSWYRS